MIVNIDNLQILIKTNSGEEYQDILTDKCTISEQTYEINTKELKNFIIFSYHLDIDIPEEKDDIIQIINDHFELIDLTEYDTRYYYSCLVNILLKTYNTPSFINVNRIYNDYIGFIKKYNVYYYYFYFILTRFSKIELIKNEIPEDIITFDIYDIIFENNL